MGPSVLPRPLLSWNPPATFDKDQSLRLEGVNGQEKPNKDGTHVYTNVVMADLLISNYDNVTIGAIVPRCGEVQKLFLLYNPPYKGLCLDLTEGKTRPWCDDSEPLENATLSNNHRMWGILPLNRGRFPMRCKDFSCRRGSWYNR